MIKYAVSCLFVLVAVGCAAPEHNAGRVHSLEFTRPAALDVMLEWPADGIRQSNRQAVFIGAYAAPAGDLRLWGGLGHYADDVGEVSAEHAFDVSASDTEQGVASASFELSLSAGGQQILRLDSAVLFDVTLDDDDRVPASARVIGILSPEMARQIRVPRLDMRLDELMEAAGTPANVDFDFDGVNESWVAEGVLQTEPVVVR